MTPEWKCASTLIYSGCGAVWQRTCFGSRGSGVQISPSRLVNRLVACGNAGHLRFCLVGRAADTRQLLASVMAAYIDTWGSDVHHLHAWNGSQASQGSMSSNLYFLRLCGEKISLGSRYCGVISENHPQHPFCADHAAALLNGSETYEDPVTGFLVFTEIALLKAGSCCGNSCRHCPYPQT